jgi:hypothetical protein
LQWEGRAVQEVDGEVVEEGVLGGVGGVLLQDRDEVVKTGALALDGPVVLHVEEHGDADAAEVA